MYWKLKAALALFHDFSARFLNQTLCFNYCSPQKPFFCHIGHIQGRMHVWLFSLFSTFLLCDSRRFVKNLKEISGCFYEWDLPYTSTIYAAIASCKLFEVCFVHSWGHVLRNLYSTSQQLTASLYSILWAVRTNGLVDGCGFRLWAAMIWSLCSVYIPAALYLHSWQPSTSNCIYSHLVPCYIISFLLVVWRTISNIPPGAHYRLLHVQHHGGLTGDYIVDVSQRVANLTKRQLVG